MNEKKRPPKDIEEKYNQLRALHQQALRAMAKPGGDAAAQAEMMRLAKELNAIEKEFDCAPRGPLQDVVDKAVRGDDTE